MYGKDMDRIRVNIPAEPDTYPEEANQPKRTQTHTLEGHSTSITHVPYRDKLKEENQQSRTSVKIYFQKRKEAERSKAQATAHRHKTRHDRKTM